MILANCNWGCGFLSATGGNFVLQKVLSASRSVRCSELRGSACRGYFCINVVGNQSVPFSLSAVERLSAFQRVRYGRFHCTQQAG